MSSLTILGDTSGSVLLQAPSVAGSTTLTLPSTTGTVALTSGLPSTNQLAKAWVVYNSSAQAISASYNVSSVTYSSTGVFIVNFSSAFSDANYAIGTGCSGGNTSLSVQNNTTTTCSFYCWYPTNNAYNTNFNSAIFFHN